MPGVDSLEHCRPGREKLGEKPLPWSRLVGCRWVERRHEWRRGTDECVRHKHRSMHRFHSYQSGEGASKTRLDAKLPA